jgi:hypothetical protein
MTDATGPGLENPTGKLGPEEIIGINKEISGKFGSVFEAAGFPTAKSVMGGEVGDDNIRFCEIRDKTTWTISVVRPKESWVTMKVHRDSYYAPGAFVEEAVGIVNPPNTPDISYRQETFSDPKFGRQEPINSEGSRGTVVRIDNLRDRISNLIVPKLGVS